MKIDLQFVGLQEMHRNIAVNGKLVKPKRNKQNEYIHTVDSVDGKCEVVIYKSNQYLGKNWFWWNLLFFFVSILGIFDMWHGSKFLVIDSRFNISTTKDAKVIMRRQNFVDGGKYVLFEGDANVEEICNIQFQDKLAKKRHSKMKKIKLALTAVVVITAVVLIAVL